MIHYVLLIPLVISNIFPIITYAQSYDFNNYVQQEPTSQLPRPKQFYHERFIPAYLRNVTREAWKELEEIMNNDNLTKAEMNAQIREWSSRQGEEVLRRYDENEQKRNELDEKVSNKIDELLRNATVIAQQLRTLRNNMQITRRQEQQQIMNIVENVSRTAFDSLRIIEEMARSEVWAENWHVVNAPLEL